MPTNAEPYVLHTWQQKQTDWNAPTVTGGEGAWLWDESGQRYLDLSAQAQCNHLGHQHPDLIAAIQRQAAELCFTHNAWGARPCAELPLRLLLKCGLDGGKVFSITSLADSPAYPT